MTLSTEAAKVSAAYDEKAGVVRKWIMRHPNTMFYASLGAVGAAFVLGMKWQKFLTWAF